MTTVEEKQAKKEKLKAAREKLDARILAYVKKKAPLTRAMNLNSDVPVPADLVEYAKSGSLNPRSDEYVKMRIIDGALQRMQSAGKIRCVKEGTPHWEAVEE